ncbi:hypothetical protein D0U04_29310 [Bacillus clarus]|uniref:Uncharacterized protein n=1 Tax=Bacillus clarus TaxID=2338372 RepID=A0ABX9KMQ3_9BACI|nr:hypothetical protein D0U04_29310 [Bacillus clarus]
MCPRPSCGLSNGIRLTLPTGEGAPSKIEGVGGVFYMGSGEAFPSGFGQSPRFLFLHGLSVIGEADVSRRAHSIVA